MQPAVADVVQNLIVPASTATAGSWRLAMMSIPWCEPPARGAPKSSEYVTGPTTGNTSRCVTAVGSGGAAAAGAARASAMISRKAVRIGGGSPAKGQTLAHLRDRDVACVSD